MFKTAGFWGSALGGIFLCEGLVLRTFFSYTG
jgi:hypothetical protein